MIFPPQKSWPNCAFTRRQSAFQHSTFQSTPETETESGYKPVGGIWVLRAGLADSGLFADFYKWLFVLTDN